MVKREREIADMIRRAGLTCVSITVCGSGHYKASVCPPGGGATIVIFSSSPGDRRGDLNKFALLRRIATGAHIKNR